MMTAKINNGTTETKTRLVRWKRRVLGFEGARRAIKHPRWPRGPRLCGLSRFLAHPSRMLGNRGTPPN